jgi:hypothetical protein
MNREAMRQISKEDFGMTTISAKMVLWILTDDQRQLWLHISSDHFMQCPCIDRFDRVITGDEIWCFQHSPETNCQSMHWKTKNLLQQKEPACLTVRSCVMFLQSQEYSSLWIHCARTDSESAVLFGNAEKFMAVCSEGKPETMESSDFCRINLLLFRKWNQTRITCVQIYYINIWYKIIYMWSANTTNNFFILQIILFHMFI